MLNHFSDRAQECVRLAIKAESAQDRELFFSLARAFYGVMPEDSETTNVDLACAPAVKPLALSLAS